MATNNETEIISSLANHTGSETFTRDPLSRCVITEGFREFLELCRCHWLFSDSAILLMMDAKYKQEDFILIKIKKTDKQAEVVFDNGNGKVLYKKKYAYTDFPLSEYEFYACRNEIGSFTFMLKSEY